MLVKIADDWISAEHVVRIHRSAERGEVTVIHLTGIEHSIISVDAKPVDVVRDINAALQSKNGGGPYR